MCSKFYFIFTFLICQLNLFAQKNLKPGYIIVNSGDTVKGFIEYTFFQKNPNRIYFFRSDKDKPTRYSPLQIKGFGVQGEVYEAAIVNVDKSPFDINELNNNQELKMQTDTTFIREIFKSPKSLYSYRDNDGRVSFFIKKNNRIEWLTYKLYLKELENGNIIVARNNEFQDQLNEYLSDCNSITKLISTTTYATSDLERLFKSYYECKSLPVEMKSLREKFVFEFGAILGVSVTSLEFNGITDNYQHLIESKYPSSQNLNAGIFFNLYFPGMKRLTLYNELLYTSYKTDYNYVEDYFSVNDNSSIYTSFAFNYLQLNTMLRYKIPFGKFSFFANAGISNGMAIKSQNKSVRQTTFYSSNTVTEGEAIEDLRKYEQGLLLGIGGKVSKVSLEARMAFGNGISPFIFIKSPTQRIIFLASFTF